MKPTFALDLTEDRVGLLHRTPKGWLSVGEVAFDAPDLTEALDYLRKTALGLSPLGIATKVVIPNSQILYLNLQVSGTAKEEKRKQIRAALEGRTPYGVDDLVFDWSGRGSAVTVAVVSRETLTEAEAFATQHRFNPVSFVAIPGPDSFVGEPWFGTADAAATLVAQGETVERDRDAIKLLHRDLPKAEAAVVVVEEAVVEPPAAPVDAPTLDDSVPEPTADLDLAIADDAHLPLPGLEEALMADASPPVSVEPTVTPAEQVDVAADDADLDMAELAAALGEVPMVEASAPADQEADVEEAPFAHVTDPLAFAGSDDALAAAAQPDIDDDLPPVPPSAAMLAFASRRAASGQAASATEGPTGLRAFGKPQEKVPALSPTPRGPAEVPAARPSNAGPSRNGSGNSFAGFVTAPTIPGTRSVKGKPGTGPSGIGSRPGLGGGATAKPLVKPGGTFAVRTPQRGKPRYMGMILTALLLIFLALVAAWASFFLASNTTSGDGTAVVDSAVPAVEDEMLADQQDPEGMTGPLPEAAGSQDSAALDATEAEAGVNLSAEVAADDPTATVQVPLVEEPAPATEVTTDLATAQPLSADQDEIFLATMDMPPPALDALALPTPAATIDALPDAPMLPPPFGTIYQFDSDGLLKPTPEGILSPEGVMLIAGKPPLVPPMRSEAVEAAALAARLAPVAAAAADPAAVPDLGPGSGADSGLDSGLYSGPTPADPALKDFRPLPRPEGLIPAAMDGAALIPSDILSLTNLRPLARPPAVLASAAAKLPAAADASPPDLGAQGASLTAQAEATLAAAAAAANPSIVAISRRPAARPVDLSSAVEAAVAAAVRDPAPEELASAEPAPVLKPEELDEVNEPDTAAAPPKIPTKANVAKQATFVNAINLSKINLIGVYGTQSDRYALIRQANGRYKKVSVGDRFDGGTVQAITETEVRYQKGGKLVLLKMPKA